jgi:methionyl-tRNA formyltransferase
MGASLLRETIEGLRNGSLSPCPQPGEASYAPSLKKEDGLIDWSKSAPEISDFIRGMNPWPGAYCHIGDEMLKILKARPLLGTGLPGVIERLSKSELIVGTGSGLLSVVELLPPGKKPMAASAFVQGRRLAQGMAVR